MRALGVAVLASVLATGCAQLFGIEDPFLDVAGDLFIESVERDADADDLIVSFCRDGGIASGGGLVEVELFDRLSNSGEIASAEIPDPDACAEARFACANLGAGTCRARFELEAVIDPADLVRERSETNNGLSRVLLQIARAFVSSTEVPGIAIGSAYEADLQCQQLAAAAGLPGAWSAWVSDFFVDVRRRVSITDLAIERVDGVALSPSLDVLLSAQMLDAPLDLDENGGAVAAGTCAWTGTGPDGFLQNDCNAWSATGVDGSFGEVGQVDSSWTFAGQLGCENRCRFYCVERGVKPGPEALDLFVGAISRGASDYTVELCNAGQTPPAGFEVPIQVLNGAANMGPLLFAQVPDSGQCTAVSAGCGELADVDCNRAIDLVVAVDPFDDVQELDEGNNLDGVSLALLSARAFVTESLVPGDGFGAVAGADARCQLEADQAGLGGTFRAWISTAASTPNATFVQHAVPYQTIDGRQIAPSYSGLTSGSLESELDVTAAGNPVSASECVWTGTTASGDSNGTDCAQWSDPGASGVFGLVGTLDVGWTDTDATGCDSPCSFYCFEQ